MRNLVYLDYDIPLGEYEKLVDEYSTFVKKHANIDAQFWMVRRDFTDYPTYLDTDGDDVMRPSFLQEIANDVDTNYGKSGADNVIVLIHSDHWKSGKTAVRKGIWGTNYSYKFGDYHIQYCRWDAKKLANSFGTMNHEIDHTFDALISTELGINVNSLLGVVNYDKNTTHGESVAYHGYIRYQENAKKLEVLAPYLVSAYAKRLKRHQDAIRGNIVGLQKNIISLLEKLVYQLRQNLNKKNGNPNS